MGRRVSIYFKDEDLLDWLKDQVEKGRYRSLSHILEKAAEDLKRRSISY